MNRYCGNVSGREWLFGRHCNDPRCAGHQTSPAGNAVSAAETGKTAVLVQHTHEYFSSTLPAGNGDAAHSHRFAGVTSEAIPIEGGGHKHTIFSLTGSSGHIHEVAAETGPEIPVGNGRHTHYVSASTTDAGGHTHKLEFCTMLDGR